MVGWGPPGGAYFVDQKYYLFGGVGVTGGWGFLASFTCPGRGSLGVWVHVRPGLSDLSGGVV